MIPIYPIFYLLKGDYEHTEGPGRGFLRYRFRKGHVSAVGASETGLALRDLGKLRGLVGGLGCRVQGLGFYQYL